jgi:L-fuculose-phosphate aldolase
MEREQDRQAKNAIVDIGKRMYQKNFVAANDGNISYRVGNLIWMTPTGVSKGFLTEDMLILMDLEGRVVAGERAPSSEAGMHLRVYRENPEVFGVVHAHPPAATAFAIARTPLDEPLYPEALVNLGSIPVAPYATPGTPQVPESIAPFCKGYKGVLLANHGLLTWGKTLLEGWYRMESAEQFARIQLYVRQLGGGIALTDEQIEKLSGPIAFRE